jgi:hypothetical protein
LKPNLPNLLNSIKALGQHKLWQVSKAESADKEHQTTSRELAANIMLQPFVLLEGLHEEFQ